jgi:CheY-like chemotaxis protein
MQPDGSIDWVNDVFEQVTGYTREDSLHRRFQEIVGSAGASANTFRTMLGTAASLQSQVAELELLNKEKSPYWAHLEIQQPTDASGQITKLLAIQSDRTAAKEFESRLDRAKDAAEAIIAAGFPLAAQALPRVLVADDNAVNRKLVAKMLAKLGFECAVAENSSEAVSAVESSHFDAVLMDLQMPEMDGLEAMQQIRKRFFLLPIIATTADVMPDDEARCAAAGMNDYLSKPVRATAD